MPSVDQAKKLFNETLSATRTKSLPWSETADDSEFITVLTGGSTVIKVKSWSFHDNRGVRSGDPSLELFRNSDETLLLRVTSTLVDSGELKELYREARNQALGIDTTVEAVLKELSDLNDIPF